MKIVIDINEESGEAVLTINDKPSEGGYHATIGHSREVTPIYTIGQPSPMVFLSGMEDFTIKLSRPGRNTPASMPEMQVWDDPGEDVDDYHVCDYYDCDICYEEE